MFAFVGYIAHANAVKFPWSMQLDGTTFPDELNPPLLWDNLSDNAKWQILIFIGFLEYWGELSTPNHTHYMVSGGKPGKYPDFVTSTTSLRHPIWLNLYDPLRLWKNKSEEEKAKGLLIEINNGRAAMFGIMGFLSSQVVPGSVPVLNRVLPGYTGEIMNPFEFHGVH
jgi:Chlorophyll A-B binding protein